MIRDRVTTHGIVRPLDPGRDRLALHINPSHLAPISARWAQVYLTDTQRHEKEYAGTMRHREPAIAPTALPALDHRKGKG